MNVFVKRVLTAKGEIDQPIARASDSIINRIVSNRGNEREPFIGHLKISRLIHGAVLNLKRVEHIRFVCTFNG